MKHCAFLSFLVLLELSLNHHVFIAYIVPLTLVPQVMTDYGLLDWAENNYDSDHLDAGKDIQDKIIICMSNVVGQVIDFYGGIYDDDTIGLILGSVLRFCVLLLDLIRAGSAPLCEGR